MKKYLSLILTTIFMFTLVSCDFYYETELEAYYYDKIKEEYEFDYNKIFFENVVKEGVEKINNETTPLPPRNRRNSRHPHQPRSSSR